MNVDATNHGNASSGYLVRAPQSTDALGHALRGVFGGGPLPADLANLLRRLDRVAH